MTPKQEAFARAYVETGNATEAYRRAYDAENMKEQVINNEAWKLLQHPEITVRIDELKAKHQKKHEITIDKLTEMALNAYKEAQRVSNTGQMQTSSMVKAAEFLGKLHGLVVERSEVTHKDGVEDLADAELANIARAGRRGIVAAPGGSSQPN